MSNFTVLGTQGRYRNHCFLQRDMYEMMILNFRYSRPMRLGIADMQQQQLTINPIMIFQWSNFYRWKNNNKYVSILVYPKITVVFFYVPLFLDTFETSSSMYWEESIGCVERPSWEGSSDISYGLFNDWTLPQRLPHHQSSTSTKKDPSPPANVQSLYTIHMSSFLKPSIPEQL